MDRLQKKCFLASAGVHSLLAVILIVGPAFISSDSKTDDLTILDFVPLKTTDAMVSGGGSPTAKPPAMSPNPQPQPPAPQPVQQRPPEPVRQKEPPPEPVKVAADTKADSDSLEPSKRRVEPNLKLVDRKPDAKAAAKAKADADARQAAKEWANAQRKIGQQISQMAGHLGDEMSGSTDIVLKGPGGGGVPYANFLQAVKSRYANAWVVPDGVTDDQATATVSVTIARDGKVVSSSITRSSGNMAVDRSVQATLDRVKYAAPLPDDAKENERTVSINFNVKAKRGLG